MRTFKVSDTLWVSTVKPFTVSPYLVLHESLPLGAATNLAIVIPLDKVKDLIGQLVEATIHLLEE